MILRRITEGPGVVPPRGPYVQAVVAEGKFVFLAGQIGKHPGTGVIPDDFMEQARQALENVKSTLAASGAQLNDVVRMLVFVTDTSRVEEFNRMYEQFFGKDFPVRTRMQAANLVPGCKIEIEAIAVLPR